MSCLSWPLALPEQPKRTTRKRNSVSQLLWPHLVSCTCRNLWTAQQRWTWLSASPRHLRTVGRLGSHSSTALVFQNLQSQSLSNPLWVLRQHSVRPRRTTRRWRKRLTLNSQSQSTPRLIKRTWRKLSSSLPTLKRWANEHYKRQSCTRANEIYLRIKICRIKKLSQCGLISFEISPITLWYCRLHPKSFHRSQKLSK